ncbi:transcriptional regulator/sugar kinase [Frankia torreyi]|uniref:Transcriptional regulator/sugar kinase n=1 Tax=Frankia torreyi TaxID=1856 RepID=A0A0D8BA97_9ACTN|nr:MULTISPECIES: ROK family protein [Frankia]KJE21116.1 transcriptional regulator/sugar kinase [Frankia torreyi]KQM03616.1 transcriptional regulator/sugar kinase [Frankia sp. CpI1-P]
MKVHAFDIGASTIKQGIVDTGPPSQLVTRLPVLRLPPTPTFHVVQERILAALTSAADVELVAIATAGAVDTDGTVVRAGAIQGYSRIHWPTLLAGFFPGLRGRVRVVNDGLAATWAEYERRGRTGTHVHFALGSGIGGGIAIGGRLAHGTPPGPAGLGHILVHPTSTVRCSCTRTGCVETLASVRAVLRGYQPPQPAASPRTSPPVRTRVPTLLELVHKTRNGDPAARRAFEAAGYWLGIAAATVLNILAPDVITVGGGLAQAAESAAGPDGGYLAAAQRAMRERAVPRLADRAVLTPSPYGANGPLIGAALLAATSEGDG